MCTNRRLIVTSLNVLTSWHKTFIETERVYYYIMSSTSTTLNITRTMNLDSGSNPTKRDICMHKLIQTISLYGMFSVFGMQRKWNIYKHGHVYTAWLDFFLNTNFTPITANQYNISHNSITCMGDFTQGTILYHNTYKQTYINLQI